MRTILALFFSSLLFHSVGCVNRPSGEVVVYASVDREYAAPLLDAFERQHPDITIARQFDVESNKTLGLVNRLIQEEKKPRCDVFWNGEILHTIRLSRRGLLEPRRWNIPSNWRSGYAASDGSWVAFASRARVLLVNKDRISDSKDYPQSVSDLSNPKWLKQCGLAKPLFGTTSTHFAVLASAQGEASRDWMRAVRDNAVILAGNKQVAIAVAAGQLAWGLTDTDDAVVEIENGMPVEIVFPDQAEGQPGTLFLPSSVAVVKGGPNPIAAGSLADYLCSEKTEERLTMASNAHFPVWPNNSGPSRAFGAIQNIRWMEVDFEKAADAWDSLAPWLMELFQ